MKLVVATSQFPVSAEVRRNARFALRQIADAAAKGAHVVHFPECALSGYAGPDLDDLGSLDWPVLEEATHAVMAAAREHRVWVLLGSTHRLSGRHKPHNSVYLIDPRGRIVDRYDKRFCAGDRSGRTSDLAHYSPGDHACTFTIRGVRCGLLICHEYRYPELVRAYKRAGVQVIFHAYHAGGVAPAVERAMRAELGADLIRLNGGGWSLAEVTMQATMQAAAASSHVWISCSNSSRPKSCFPAFFVRPDGMVSGRLQRHRAGLLISTVDPAETFYDSTVAWRKRAMDGRFHSGRLVRDPRSRDRTGL